MDWQKQVEGGLDSQNRYSDTNVLNRKRDRLWGLLPNVAELFTELSENNKRLISEFMLDLVNRKNIAVNTKAVHLKNLVYLVRYWKGDNKQADLDNMKREHIDGYLQSPRRTRKDDLDQKWISTHNNRTSKASIHC